MCRTRAVDYAPVSVVTQDAKQIPCCIHIGEPILICSKKLPHCIAELIVLHQRRDHGQEERCTIFSAAVHLVCLHHLRVLIIDTGHDAPCCRIIHGDVIDIRARRRLIFRNALCTGTAYSALHSPILTLAIGKDSLDSGRAQSRLCPIAILGRDVDLFGTLIKRLRQGAPKNELHCHSYSRSVSFVI